MGKSRIKRYCIIKYDKVKVDRLISLGRYVYDLVEKDDELYITSYLPSNKHEKVIIADSLIGLTSLYDKMNFKIFKCSNFINDSSIAN